MLIFTFFNASMSLSFFNQQQNKLTNPHVSFQLDIFTMSPMSNYSWTISLSSKDKKNFSLNRQTEIIRLIHLVFCGRITRQIDIDPT